MCIRKLQVLCMWLLQDRDQNRAKKVWRKRRKMKNYARRWRHSSLLTINAKTRRLVAFANENFCDFHLQLLKRQWWWDDEKETKTRKANKFIRNIFQISEVKTSLFVIFFNHHRLGIAQHRSRLSLKSLLRYTIVLCCKKAQKGNSRSSKICREEKEKKVVDDDNQRRMLRRNCMQLDMINSRMARDVEKLPFHVSSTIFQLQNILTINATVESRWKRMKSERRIRATTKNGKKSLLAIVKKRIVSDSEF